MERPEIVLDASVIVKWFTQESHTEDALKAKEAYERGNCDIIAPSLLPFEVGNALRYNPQFGATDIKDALTALEDLQLSLFELRGELAQKAVDIAVNYGITLYDSSYLALGEIRRCRVYSADEKVLVKVKHPQLRHIKEF